MTKKEARDEKTQRLKNKFAARDVNRFEPLNDHGGSTAQFLDALSAARKPETKKKLKPLHDMMKIDLSGR